MVIQPAFAFLLAITPGVASMAPQANEPAPAVSRCIRLLRDSRHADAMPAPELALRLRADVLRAHPSLVDVLVAGLVPAIDADEHIQTLSVPQRDMILEAFGHLPRAELLLQVDRLLEPEAPGVSASAVAARLLALGAGEVGLGRLFSLLEPAEDQTLDRRSEDALEWSIEWMLSQDSRATRQRLRCELGHVSEAQLHAVLRALGDHGDPAGLDVLLPIAQSHPGLRLKAFAQARRLGASGDPDLDERLAELLGGSLSPMTPNLARTAALALGELSSPEYMQELIDLLETRFACSEAHWALTRISGLKLAPDPARWRHWLADEREFFRDSYSDCLRDLHGRHAGRAVAAIRELSRHQLYRHEIAGELAYALDRAEPGRLRILCNALEAMGSRTGAPALVPLLEYPDPVVVAASLRALRAITGLELPSDPAGWDEALGSKP